VATQAGNLNNDDLFHKALDLQISTAAGALQRGSLSSVKFQHASINVTWQQAARTTTHHVAALHEPYKKTKQCLFLHAKMLEDSLEKKKSGVWTISRNMTRQKQQQD